MRRSIEVVREFMRDSHSFKRERGVESAPEKFRVYACESATRNVEGVFYFQRRRFLPNRVASDPVVKLSDENPIGCAFKRGTHPLLVHLRACTSGHFWI